MQPWARRRSSTHGRRDAARLPNPGAWLEIENFNGNGPYRVTGVAETTFSVVLPVEFGGKRGARIAAGRWRGCARSS